VAIIALSGGFSIILPRCPSHRGGHAAYDVIRPAEREAFAARHPNNMVHLILPQALPGRPAHQPLHPGGSALPPMGGRGGAGAGSGAGVLLLGDRVSACRACLYPGRLGRPGAPGASERGQHPAPRTDLFGGQGRPPGVVQGLPGQLLPIFPSIPTPPTGW